MGKRKLDVSDILLETIIEGIREVKGIDTSILDLKKIETAVCKYFVICSGTSNTHVSSIADSVKKNVSKEIQEKPWHIEGLNTSEWVLIDYSDIVVHVFQEETREFYRLEDLWGDAKIKTIEN
ncbi:MAG: ribosome silencing factor [Flavobacteriales bacterium]|nr:ribosome silencing factor [Flavobacteriales bacterium]MDG1719182.1 ribosome silencing factor [Flavobacteriales bacterium]|tara:strand:+ start:472 stop:840 length:369 start_codon:yes stop_codon:yes gene_type:complete